MSILHQLKRLQKDALAASLWPGQDGDVTKLNFAFSYLPQVLHLKRFVFPFLAHTAVSIPPS